MLLLIILGILAMFGLIAVAFVVLSSQAMRSARTIQRIEVQADPPDRLLHQAVLQLVRGTDSPGSVIGPHSLLEDIYGNESVTGQITSVQLIAGGQLVEFDYTLSNPPDSYPWRRPGCVLTVTSGSAAGVSTRIVGVGPSTGRLQMLAEGSLPLGPDQKPGFADVDDDTNGTTDDASEIGAAGSDDLKAGDQFVINGTPFSGTGFGFNPASTTGLLDALAPPGEDLNGDGVLDPGEDLNGNGTLDASLGWDWPYALTPNPAAFLPNLAGGSTYDDWAGPGGANEDYDAVDFQNMLLGAQIPDGSGGMVTIPSLHRPALVRYWMNQDGAATWRDLDPELLRRISLRPDPNDHPKFANSTPDFNAAWDGVDPSAGSWDVDNDGDGLTDSIWVDLGMPVRSTPDGRLYKPLFAILCVDLDGRLNLNAHGSLAQAADSYDDPPDLPPGILAGQYAGGGMPAAYGQGFGPAEINLSGILPGVEYQQLLRGNGTYGGRYGFATPGASVPAPGPAFVPGPSFDTADPLSTNKGYVYAADENDENDIAALRDQYYWWDFLYYADYIPDAYGTPPDPFGVGVVGLDPAGRPLYRGINYRGLSGYLGAGTTTYLGAGSACFDATHAMNSPYALNLGRRAARGLSSSGASPENPFSVAELERVLRPFDRDATRLPDRLIELAPSLTGYRHEITTESWDLPCPGVVAPHELRAFLPDRRARHLTDLLRAKLIKVNRNSPPTDAQIRAMVRQLLPQEMAAGLKMDINRPFGNGRDDNGNDVVDEPGEAGNLTLIQRPPRPGDPPGANEWTGTFSFDGEGNVANSLEARQLFARHLYVLALLLVDHTVATPSNPTPKEANRAHRVAQWAVNVVDFRDRDSIMTPFEYDVSPFTDENGGDNTWDVDGIVDEENPPGSGTLPPGSDDSESWRGLVWGCERPELLITETLAFHDRRTEDTNLETPNGETTTQDGGDADTEPDTDFDQKYRPQGSFFVEVFNPWTAMEPRSGELYTGHNGAVDLTRVHTRTGPGSPVWRLAVCLPTGDNEQPDPDDPDVNKRPDVERAVYFNDETTCAGTPVVGSPVRADVRFFPASTPPTGMVSPGGYAVIGPGEADAARPTKTYIGFRDNETVGDPDDTRQIDLALAGTRHLVLNNNDALPADTKIFPPAVVKIDKAQTVSDPLPVSRRLSVSEPVDGYSPVPGATAYDPSSEGWVDAAGQPVTGDQPQDDHDPQLAADQTITKYRIVHLQRLANPLESWKEKANPYLTIDSMAVDLTAFNGVTNDPDPNSSGGGQTKFVSRRRGKTEHAAVPGINNIWKQEPARLSPRDIPDPVPANLTDTHYFNKRLAHSLGYLNREYFGEPLAASTGYQGDPPRPFPWLTWNNRPFVSQLELMLVPKFRSSKLLVRNDNPIQTDYYFNIVKSGASLRPYDTLNPKEVPFPHLLNFFYSDQSVVPSDQVVRGINMEMHRLFEYLHVPSRFVGTETQCNPEVFETSSGHSFLPPFHWISNYREPGRININTVFSKDVAEGLMNGFPGMGPTKWDQFREGRGGYSGSKDLTIDPQYPTRFVRPFRSAVAAALVPPLLPGGTYDPTLEPAREVEATLLRSDNPSTKSNTPLFAHSSSQQVDDTDRNPYFRYQALQRLGNLVTTRSNVYAIWITVGYFEVQPVPPPVDLRKYPDSYQLGQELGLETGEVERHRAFYIYDRSIPVGFQRGQDLNVEKAVLLRRYIE